MANRKIDFKAWGYSDDCAGMTGVEDGEGEVPSKWYKFIVDGQVIGKCRMEYTSPDWEFQIVCNNGHKVKAE